MRTALGLILVLLASCQSGKPVLALKSPSVTVVPAGSLTKNTYWRGIVRVEGLVKIPKGVTLKIAPGSRIEFSYLDTDHDGVGESGLYVDGRILASGTSEEPIIFTGAGNIKPRPSAWDEIKIEHSPINKFDWCQFRYANWGLHIHYSGVDITNTIFERNYGGLRFRSGPIKIEYCRILDNRIGVRFIGSEPVIRHNEIGRNGIGIFIREGVRKPIIAYNNFFDNQKYHISLGENQSHDVNCSHNMWGTEDYGVIEEFLFDKLDHDYLGRIRYLPIYTTY